MLMVRGHNEGTVFRRRTGQWVSAVTMRDGRRVSRITHSRPEANAALTELLRLRDAGAPITGRIRLGDYLERWVATDHDMAPATLRKHRSIIRIHLIPELGHVRLSELSPSDVSQALRRLRERRLDGRSVGHVRATLRRSLADALRDGLIQRNVAALAKPLPVTARERTVLDATQARTLIESTRGTRYGPLWTILVTTGLRISEALGLAWSDVDLEERPRKLSTDSGGGSSGAGITVRHQLARENGEWVRRKPKTAKGRRTIPLTPLGVEALRAQRDQQRQDHGIPSTDGLVFTTSRGHPLHSENTVKALYQALDAAGLPRVTQHDLRHSCATLLFAQGVPLAVISRILGHSTIRITADIYTHNVDALNRDASDKMQEALG